jgi:hypothetical protein
MENNYIPVREIQICNGEIYKVVSSNTKRNLTESTILKCLMCNSYINNTPNQNHLIQNEDANGNISMNEPWVKNSNSKPADLCITEYNNGDIFGFKVMQ